MCLTWGYLFADCPSNHYAHLWVTERTYPCEAKTANPDKSCNQHDWINCNIAQHCPTCITKNELGPIRTQEYPIATLDEEERIEADRVFNLDCKEAIEGRLDNTAWIFDHQNDRLEHPDPNPQAPVFPVERPLSMEDYAWLADLEIIMHERIWEHWGWDKTEWEPSDNEDDGSESEQGRVERIHVPWTTKPSEDQLQNYYRVRAALLMANTEFWVALFKKNRDLFLEYYPFGDRRPKQHIVWERLKPALAFLELDVLDPDSDPTDCIICLEPLGDRCEPPENEPYKTTYSNCGAIRDSPVRLPCNHIIGYQCLWRWLREWDEEDFTGPLTICPLDRREFGAGRPKVLFEDGEERRFVDELDPRLVDDSTFLAEINENPTPWWLELLRG